MRKGNPGQFTEPWSLGSEAARALLPHTHPSTLLWTEVWLPGERIKVNPAMSGPWPCSVFQKQTGRKPGHTVNFKSLDLYGFDLMDMDLNVAWGHLECLPKGWVAHAYNPSTIEMETGGPGAQIKVILGCAVSLRRASMPWDLVHKQTQTNKYCRRSRGL